MNTIGQRIKKVRLALNLSRRELGEILELNNPDIRVGSYENDKKFPRMAMVDKIANALGVSRDWLLTGKLDEETYDGLHNNNAWFYVYDKFEKPVYLFQFMNALERNQNVINDCLQKEDIIELWNIIETKVQQVQGNIDMLIPPVSVEEYNDWMQQQEEEKEALIQNGDAYIDENGSFHYTE
ncbi:helix-turn-helix transcriptional regulator [[Clostridium] innocuum]|nr:helix-turn-helix transcriptional regulator [[Clostridium] innocuum]